MLKKFKIHIIGLLSLALLSLILFIVFVSLAGSVSLELVSENMLEYPLKFNTVDFWGKVPGSLNRIYNKSHYFYNITTSIDDVKFKFFIFRSS